MAKRRLFPRRPKLHHSYSVAELALLLGVHKNTVGNWHKKGMRAIDNHKPTLFMGADVTRFLAERRDAKRSRLKAGEIYCVACHAPRRPALDMVDYVPLTPNGGNLRGLCPACDRYIYRRVSLAQMPSVAAQLSVTPAEPVPSLKGRLEPSVICVEQQGA